MSGIHRKKMGVDIESTSIVRIGKAADRMTE